MQLCLSAYVFVYVSTWLRSTFLPDHDVQGETMCTSYKCIILHELMMTRYLCDVALFRIRWYLSVSSVLAPSSSSVCTTLVSPFLAASISAVKPSLS